MNDPVQNFCSNNFFLNQHICVTDSGPGRLKQIVETWAVYGLWAWTICLWQFMWHTVHPRKYWIN